MSAPTPRPVFPWIAAVALLATAPVVPAQRASEAERNGENGQGAVAVPEGAELRRDVVYGQGGGRDLKLDLFLPKAGGGPRPVVVYVHGGGWKGGTRAQFHRQASRLAADGYVGACIEYRLSGEAPFPGAIEDVKCAIRWVRSQAAALALDPDRVAVAGGSAGGHLAALAATLNPGDGFEGSGGNEGHSSKPNLAIIFNGAVDPAPLATRATNNPDNFVAKFFGGTPDEKPDNYRQATPATWVDRSDPPFLFLHGTVDATVPIGQARDLMKRLQAEGVAAEIFEVEGANHAFFNFDPHFGTCLDRMKRFLGERFGARTP